jgi:hypothetical protein
VLMAAEAAVGRDLLLDLAGLVQIVVLQEI